jgi:hypothetical protein
VLIRIEKMHTLRRDWVQITETMVKDEDESFTGEYGRSTHHFTPFEERFFFSIFILEHDIIDTEAHDPATNPGDIQQGNATLHVEIDPYQQRLIGINCRLSRPHCIFVHPPHRSLQRAGFMGEFQ